MESVLYVLLFSGVTAVYVVPLGTGDRPFWGIHEPLRHRSCNLGDGYATGTTETQKIHSPTSTMVNGGPTVITTT